MRLRPASGLRPSGWVAVADCCAERGTDDHPVVLRSVSVLTSLMGPADSPRDQMAGSGVQGTIVCSDHRRRLCRRLRREHAPRPGCRGGTMSRTSDGFRTSSARQRSSRRHHRILVHIYGSVAVRARTVMRQTPGQVQVSPSQRIRQIPLDDCFIGRLAQESLKSCLVLNVRQYLGASYFRTLCPVTADQD